MKVAGAFIFCIVFAGISASKAQEVHDSRKDHAALDGYLAALTKKSDPYFYGLYVNCYLSVLDASDSSTIKKFFSTPNSTSHHRSILVTRISDLERLNNLEDTVLVFGPRVMGPFVCDYIPASQPLRSAQKRRDFFSLINPFGFSPYRVAYGRWSMPYSLTMVASNPNSLPYYMTNTNTNKYLRPFEK